MTKSQIIFIGLVVGALIGLYLVSRPESSLGSVVVGNDYQATTTNAASTAIRTIKSGAGSFGSLVITGDNTGTMTFYNATTSNVDLRTGNKATSSITIADFPASSPEGTYTFDAEFTDGLLVVTTGAPATSTVIWR
jgi:hypothetical protein